ncbi:hypothetical protein C8Q74DRAFT_1013969 [Fomes fomentarius]|nr:hypothetical protein C8Q74DRAFT_1013969 [Fomes fomentarius]
MTSLQLPVLPADVMQSVVDACPRTTQKTLLFASTTFHDLAFRALFSHLRIYIGIKNPREQWLERDAVARSLVDHKRSVEFLQQIPGNPAFANAVRGLTIWCRTYWINQDNINETILVLSEALKALPMLETFSWYGHGRMQTTNPPEAVIKALNPELRVFRATLSQIAPGEFTLPPAAKAIFIMIDSRSSARDLSPAVAAKTTKILQNNAANVQKLVVYQELPLDCPLPALKSLQVDMTDGSGLRSVFNHSTQLTSLSLYFIAGSYRLPLELMQTMPDAFPLLEAFHLLLIGPGLAPNAGAVISAFIRPKKLLRSLVVGADESEPIKSAMAVLAELPRLEVLSFGELDNADSDAYINHLPPGITTLYLRTSLYFPSPDLQTVFPDILKRLPRLRMFQLSMVDNFPPSDVQDALLALARTAHETLEIVSFRPECAKVICRGRPRPALFCADHSTDRILPGECQLLDDWLWLAPFEMVDYGHMRLDIPECQACGTPKRRCTLADRFDIRSLEKTYHRSPTYNKFER